MDVNTSATTDDNICILPLVCACQRDNIKMVELLMSHGADPNIRSTTDNDLLMYPIDAAAASGNLSMIKVLLNVDKKYKLSFDWDKLINHSFAESGYTMFHMLCENGYLDCIKYFMSIENKYNTKIDWYKKSDEGINPLLLACSSTNIETINVVFLVIYCIFNYISVILH